MIASLHACNCRYLAHPVRGPFRQFEKSEYSEAAKKTLENLLIFISSFCSRKHLTLRRDCNSLYCLEMNTANEIM